MRLRPLAIGVFLISFAWTVYVLMAGAGYDPIGRSWDFDTSAKLGDSFGPLNTLMATVAAIGAIAAYISQSDELKQAKTELDRERKAADKRDFENTFFNLIPLLRSTLNEIHANDMYNQDPKYGRDALRRILDEQIGKSKGSDDQDKASYQSSYRRNRDGLGHYFRLIYQIMRFIDESNIDDRKLYIRILRANISNAEMVLIGLNCVYGGGYPKFKKLIEKHALLHNISSSEAIARRLHLLLEPGAFGDRDLIADSKN